MQYIKSKTTTLLGTTTIHHDETPFALSIEDESGKAQVYSEEHEDVDEIVVDDSHALRVFAALLHEAADRLDDKPQEFEIGQVIDIRCGKTPLARYFQGKTVEKDSEEAARFRNRWVDFVFANVDRLVLKDQDATRMVLEPLDNDGNRLFDNGKADTRISKHLDRSIYDGALVFVIDRPEGCLLPQKVSNVSDV